MPRIGGAAAVALITLTALVAALAGISGYARAEIGDRDEFARRVASTLDDRAVRVVLAERVVDGLTPVLAIDALAVRPLLVAGVESLIRTAPFRRVVFRLAGSRHGALVDGDGGVVFDLAARGGVLLDALHSISPRAADAIPRGLKLPILVLRPHQFETLIVDWISRIAGWWWPLLAASLAPAAACAALAGGVREAVGRVSVAAAGAGLAVAAAVAGFGSFTVAHASNATGLRSDGERQALRALWSALFGDLQTAALVTALAGAIVAALAAGAPVARGVDAATDLARRAARTRRTGAPAARAALLAALGLGLVLEPSATVRVLAVVAGVLLMLIGIGRLAARAGAGAVGSPRRAATGALAGATVLLLAATAGAVALVLPSPTLRSIAPAPAGACNGAVTLCDRRLDRVVFASTHNSYAASRQPGWYFASQRHGIARQLDDGIRGLLIDVHYGVRDPASGRVRTDLAYEGSSRNKVIQQLGPEAVRTAERLAGRVGVAPIAGRRELFLCHTLCELGAEPLGAELAVIRRFLDAQPREVLIVFVEPYVSVESIERAFDEARLLPELAELHRDRPLPTLRDLIRAGTPLVVFAEEDGGARPWYLPGFSFVQDTPLGARRPGQLSCARARGDADSPLLLFNHWLDAVAPSISRNQAISGEFLRRRLARCQRERGPEAQLHRRRLLRAHRCGRAGQATQWRIGLTSARPGSDAGMPAGCGSDLDRALAAARPVTERLCAEVWQLSELSFEEVESARIHTRELEAAGFSLVSTGTSGLPTAFVAEWRQDAAGPKVGFLPEYDALPGLGNAPVPRLEERADGRQSGHGCGHNLLGAALTGAAIAAKEAMSLQASPARCASKTTCSRRRSRAPRKAQAPSE